MKKIMLLALLVGLCQGAFSQEINYDNGQLFVKVKSGKTLEKTNLMKEVKHLFGDIYLVKTQDAMKLQENLKANDSVLYTEKNYYAGKKELPEAKALDASLFNTLTSADSLFNDPEVSKVWAFEDAKDNGISVNKAYRNALNKTQTEIIVAVVDTGVDYNHEDLKDVMWTNTQEISGNGIDDDNNGYVDDVHGINTLVRDQSGVASGNPMASHDHGTHVSGTIAATQNNGVGIAGIASHTKIMAIRTVPDNADETDVDIVESFLYAAKHGAKLINCSFGKGHNEGGMIVNETIDHIGKTYGTLTVAAAGNDSMWIFKHDLDKKPKYPAAFESDYLLVVASTDPSGSLSFFSNVGKKSVDVSAPGSSIYSTVKNNGYASMDGTSMATPAVVGVAAEVLSFFPELSPVELKKVLMKSVTPVSKFDRYMQSGGRVDLYEALQLANKQ